MNFNFRPTQAYTKDTGLIFVFSLLLVAYWQKNLGLIPSAVAMLLATMTIPVIFKPLAVIWYYFSLLLAKITNRVVLSLIFTVVITPIGLIRRCMGFDPMRRKMWKKGTASIFVERNHRFTENDLTTPF